LNIVVIHLEAPYRPTDSELKPKIHTLTRDGRFNR
jgi:hypothetical protein